MTKLHHSHHAFQPEKRRPNPVARTLPIPIERLDNAPIFQHIAHLTKRTPPSSSSSSGSSSSPSSTCAPNDNSARCQRPVSVANITTLTIVLGAVIPVTLAIVIFIILHRRHVKKLRSEDANDKHKSLDFGMDTAGGPIDGTKNKKKKKKGIPEMTVSDHNLEKDLRHGRGLSMDMGSPYLLPPGLQSSQESIHSLSLTVQSGDDRYRPATTFIPNDSSLMRSYPESIKKAVDDSSSYTGSSKRGYGHEGMNRDLLRNAQRMSRSAPLTQLDSVMSGHKMPQIQAPEPSYGGLSRKVPLSNPGLGGLTPSSAAAAYDSRDSYVSNGPDMRKSHQYLGAFIHSREPSADLLTKSPDRAEPQELPTTVPPTLQQAEVQKSAPVTVNTLPVHPTLPRLQSMEAPVHEESDQNFLDDESDYGDASKVTPPSPGRTSELPPVTAGRRSLEAPMAVSKEFASGGLDAPALGFDVRRLSMGFRPLPPEDPTDNPEQRANRIRSFYKDYFDDSKPGPTHQAGYQEDYGQEYLADGAIFDPATGQFTVGQVPYAQPMTRRAMTPPPRAPPRFQAPPRHQSTMSNGRFMPPGPRAFSSELGRSGPAGRGPPRKPMPPPAPLRVLPTPHLLQEDSFTLPIDFAPPTSYKDRQAGRPASPLGGTRPYSPMLPSHLPLASSFEDLSVMPSPHALRKSSTFTALDFAPPPRFKHSDTTSDAGSIRSNRSAMSAAQLHNIRSGAYRISRIPKEVVGTKTDIAASLKPTWDVRHQGA